MHTAGQGPAPPNGQLPVVLNCTVRSLLAAVDWGEKIQEDKILLQLAHTCLLTLAYLT